MCVDMTTRKRSFPGRTERKRKRSKRKERGQGGQEASVQGAKRQGGYRGHSGATQSAIKRTHTSCHHQERIMGESKEPRLHSDKSSKAIITWNSGHCV